MHHATLFQQIIVNMSTNRIALYKRRCISPLSSHLYLIVEIDVHVLAETAAVIVALRACIAKRL